MSRRVLKSLTIVLPALFWGCLILLRVFLSPSAISWGQEILFFLFILIGATLFSNWVFGIIEQRELESQSRAEQLAALHEAALTLTRELDLGTVLQYVVDLARELSSARYGALGVLGEGGEQIAQSITSGISSRRSGRTGSPPQGSGVLGIMIHKGQSIRIPNIIQDPRTIGFPPHHPVMKSLLGVPIKFKGKVIGDLYLGDKLTLAGEITEFSEGDQQILEMFAAQAAIVIKNAQLYRKSQQLIILQERERFGMNLHDGIIQSIYAIGLMLEDIQHRINEEPLEAYKGITRSVQGLNEVIRDIRNYILDLRPQRFQGRDLREGLAELVRDLRANTFLDVNLNTNSVDTTSLAPEKTVEILHIAQEALLNARKHAHATWVDVSLQKNGRMLTLIVTDDGIGLTPEVVNNATGNGLHNMRERAHLLGGMVEFDAPGEGGTRVVLSVP